MELGMIGLGRMGASMVQRLEKAGHHCVVYDMSAKAVEGSVAQGATGAASLEELVNKGLIASVPLDPYDGKALRFKPVADGVIVYSVGPDRTDNGGNIDRTKPTSVGTDLGFQLWDVKHRRQPAKAKNHP